MGFGMRIRGLWRIRGWVVACAVFALAADGLERREDQPRARPG